MTPDDITKLLDEVKEAIDAYVLAEREACAKVAEEWYERGLGYEVTWDDSLYPDVAKIAAAIRARGNADPRKGASLDWPEGDAFVRACRGQK